MIGSLQPRSLAQQQLKGFTTTPGEVGILGIHQGRRAFVVGPLRVGTLLQRPVNHYA